MALLHIHTPPQSITTLFPILSFHSPPPLHFSLPHSTLKTHQQNSLFSTTKNTPFSLSTLPRKLLCQPPRGKHVREDYLVKKLSAQEVQELVKGERNVPIIIDFYATWYGPCILMAQELEMEDGEGTKLSDQVSDKNNMETDSSTPALYSDKEKSRSKKMKTKMEKKKRRRREDLEIADSIRWLAEVVVRSEQARMETMREIERMRVEAEAKRGEMDLKRTEILANTQLEIARLFAGIGKGVDSSSRFDVKWFP